MKAIAIVAGFKTATVRAILLAFAAVVAFWPGYVLADPSPGALPDILGIQIGMPLAQAVPILKAHNPDLQIVFRYQDGLVQDNGNGPASFTATWVGTNKADTYAVRETLVVQGAWAPPHAVYLISRDGLGKAARTGAGNFVGALQKRYGPEYSHDYGYNSYHWNFDSEGHSLSGVKECSGGGPIAPQPCRGIHLGYGGQNGFQESLTNLVAQDHEQVEADKRYKEKVAKAQQERKQEVEKIKPEL